MHRRFSSLVKGSSSSSYPVNEKTIYDDDDDSKASTIARAEPLPVPSLKVKRVDNYYSRWSKTWKYRVRLHRHLRPSLICLWYLCRTPVPSTQLRPSRSCKVMVMISGKTLALCKGELFLLRSSYWNISIWTFRIVRTINQIEGIEPTYKIVIKSGYILKACKDVIKSWPGISWNSDPLEVTSSALESCQTTLITVKMYR